MRETPRAMRVLGIESSCDETAAAIVDCDASADAGALPPGRVLVDVIASQFAVHAPYGGVVPELASRAHVANVGPVVRRALEACGGSWESIDGLAITQGPGLSGALLVGMQVGKTLALSLDLPLVHVDHLVGHLLAVHLTREGQPQDARPALPYVALLASGGHTAIYEVRGDDDVEMIGQTRDDAAGEAFDKAGKLLGLGYPGGPRVDRLAKLGDPSAVTLPKPMASTRTLDFSFSRLKTALARHVAEHGVPQDERGLADVCAAFQHAVVEVLSRKAVAACERRKIPRLVLAGGVAANSGLRARAGQLCTSRGVTLYVPSLASCTDNAAMIAYAGALRLLRGERDALDLPAYTRSANLRRGKVR